MKWKTWVDRARAIIAAEHAKMPDHISPQERRQIIRDAYPWGARENYPYKAWCAAQREYLSRFQPRVPHKQPDFGLFEKLGAE